MANLSIDRLTLKLSGLSHQEGEQLAQLITTRLANSDVTGNSLHDVPSLQLNVTSSPSTNIDWLANQIVSEILRQLTHSLS